MFAVFTDIAYVVHTCRDSNTYVPGLRKYVLTYLYVNTYVPEFKYVSIWTQPRTYGSVLQHLCARTQTRTTVQNQRNPI